MIMIIIVVSTVGDGDGSVVLCVAVQYNLIHYAKHSQKCFTYTQHNLYTAVTCILLHSKPKGYVQVLLAWDMMGYVCTSTADKKEQHCCHGSKTSTS